MGFQNQFQDGETPQITSQRSLKKYIGHDKGDSGPSSLKNNVLIFLKVVCVFVCLFFFVLRMYVRFQSPFWSGGTIGKFKYLCFPCSD